MTTTTLTRNALLLAATLAGGCAASKPEVREQPAAQAAAPATAEPSAAEEGNLPGEDGFAVEGMVGTLEPDHVEASFAKSRAAVDACYTAQVAKFPWLGGVLELKLRVDRAGAVKIAALQKPLGNLDVEQCVLGVARGMTFPKPKGGPEAEFTYSFTFRGRMSLTPWSHAEVGPVFAKNRPALDGCAKKGTPGGLPASLRVALFVVPGGTAPSVGVGADAPIEPAYAACLSQTISKWKFSDPRGRVARAEYQF